MLRAEPIPHSASHPTIRLTLVFLLAIAVCAGCTRSYYRTQADVVGGGLMRQFGNEAGQPPVDSTWRPPAPQSRLYDSNDPDFPPATPDDPLAHTRMERVDGMRAYNWDKYGVVPADDYHWLPYLPYDAEGRVVIDMNGAVQLAFMNSREYRKELEDLYLSALDVSFERFRFAAQFFGGNDTFYSAIGRDRGGNGRTHFGGETQTLLTTDSNIQVNKLYAAGGQLTADLANSIIWSFSGTNVDTNVSLLSFNFFQPLLRFGGRARILERLTLVERQLIYNVRQMEQYRQGYFAQVATGRSPGDGPNRRGGVSGAGLQGFNGISGGFGRINVATTTATGVVDAGGFLGLLQDQIQIQNQEANVTTLRDSLNRLQDEFDADRIKDKFQVELARQALYEGQSRLLAAKAQFQTRLDTFKVFLGLPPQMEFVVDDPMLRQFQLIDPAMTKLTERAGEIAIKPHDPGAAVTTADLDELIDLRTAVDEHFAVVEQDFATLEKNMPQRIAQLEALQTRAEVEQGEVDPAAYSVEALETRRNILRRDLDALTKGLDETWGEVEKLRTDLPNLTPKEARDRLDRINPVLSSQLLALSLAQARARVDAIIWTPIDMTWEEALETARVNRRDWMNARGSLVDTWRLIQFNANALRAGLNVVMSGDLATANDNPVNFRGSTGRLNAGLEFDAPLTRVAERNIYRQSLIEYQQARRAYMLFEDRVCQSLRAILRTIELNQLNFEIRRSAVQVAIQQVDLARETLSRPLRPGELPVDYAAARASIGRDLVTALGSLLQDQNDFITVWVSYEVQRISLDLEMGTMQLDDQGMWMDPGPVRRGEYEPLFDPRPGELVPDLVEPEALPAPLNPGEGPKIQIAQPPINDGE